MRSVDVLHGISPVLVVLLLLASACSDKAEDSNKHKRSSHRIEAKDPKIRGASIEVPYGAYDAPQNITIEIGTTISADTPVPTSEAAIALGPPIQFGPEGTEFSESAIVSLPVSFKVLRKAMYDGLKNGSKYTHLAVISQDSDTDPVGFVVGPVNLVGFVVGPVNSPVDLIGFVVGPVNSGGIDLSGTRNSLSISDNKASADNDLLVKFEVDHFTTYQVVAVSCDGPTVAGKSADGTEVKDAYCCIPKCFERGCGESDGCGGTCTCGEGETCNDSGKCVQEGPCTPDCDGKECGDDGCDGNCGTCTDAQICDAGQCICKPLCDDKECGDDDGCGGHCNTCSSGKACSKEFGCLDCAQWSLVSAGGMSTAALFNGNLWTWGNNDTQQLGQTEVDPQIPVNPDIQPTTAQVNPPKLVQLDEDATVVSVAMGPQHACAVLNNGDAMCWGSHTLSEDESTRTTIEHPNKGSEVGFNHVVVGASHTCALDTIGGLYCWGDNTLGQLGIGDNPKANTPTQVVVNVDDQQATWAQISAGDKHTCGITSAGFMYCWGHNQVQQLGLGEWQGTSVSTPQKITVDSVSHWKQVSAGFTHTCAITREDCENDEIECLGDGHLFCWGANDSGQLGLGNETAQSKPSKVAATANVKRWLNVSVGTIHTCAIAEATEASENTLHCWGHNGSGELGAGLVGSSSTPVAVKLGYNPPFTPKSWSSVSAGYAHTCAIQSTGDAHSLRCWGANSYGQLGDCLKSTCLSNSSGVALCPCQFSCSDDKACNGHTGQCQEFCKQEPCPCVPDCHKKECGDDGCGGACSGIPMEGICTESKAAKNCVDCEQEPTAQGCKGKYIKFGWVLSQCNKGTDCVKNGNDKPFCCKVDCTGKQCGDNGCGGTCGDVTDLGACGPGDQISQCVDCTSDANKDSPDCQSNPNLKHALSVNDCADSGKVCVAPAEQSVYCCEPTCTGESCGDDGCGGVCNTCSNGMGCSGVGATGCELANSCADASAWALDYTVLQQAPISMTGGLLGSSTVDFFTAEAKGQCQYKDNQGQDVTFSGFPLCGINCADRLIAINVPKDALKDKTNVGFKVDAWGIGNTEDPEQKCNSKLGLLALNNCNGTPDGIEPDACLGSALSTPVAEESCPNCVLLDLNCPSDTIHRAELYVTLKDSDVDQDPPETVYVSIEDVNSVAGVVALNLCAWSCDDKICGDDGCGGSCGSCGENNECVAGACKPTCIPECVGKKCGDDGCGGTCGDCDPSKECIEGSCKLKCTPDCAGKQCGDNGCGGTCGTCDDAKGTYTLTNAALGQLILQPFVGTQTAKEIATASSVKFKSYLDNEAANKMVLWLYKTQGTSNVNLVVAFSKPGQGKAGAYRMMITDAKDETSEMTFQVATSGGGDTFVLNTTTGNGVVDVAWDNKKNEGFVLGPLPDQFCLSLHSIESSNIEQLVISEPKGGTGKEYQFTSYAAKPLVLCGQVKKKAVANQSCSASNQCECVVTCASDQKCGHNSCGQPCGTCGLGQYCNPQGKCKKLCTGSTVFDGANCVQKCQSSSDCGEAQVCQDPFCKTQCNSGGTTTQCIDETSFQTCCADGSGCFQDTVETCSGDEVCVVETKLSGASCCVPTCTGKECGDDGCGGTCGTCNADETCTENSGVFECQLTGCIPDCKKKECGDNGCGGLCGECEVGEICVSGAAGNTCELD